MWLLNAETECLEHAVSDKSAQSKDEKPYAILSHRWLKDNVQEVSYSDVRSNVAKKPGRSSKAWLSRVLAKPAYSKKAGYRKVSLACKQAREHGLKYVWIDTCCINKADEAETAESIRSMYNWYRQARVCYVYLADVTAERLDVFGKQTAGPEKQSDWRLQLEDSEWFNRGWTLQELLAPRVVNFYNADMKYLGTLEDLAHAVAGITRIQRSCLTRYIDQSELSLSDYSYAERLSWAARRETSRGEDRTYSLMGIFGVHLPILYSEGSKNAFRRLQEELLKRSADQSLLVWSGPSGGLLSPSIDYFKDCEMIVNNPCASRSSDTMLDDKQYRTFLPIISVDDLPAEKAADLRDDVGGTHLALLNCRYLGDRECGPALCLHRLSRRERNNDLRCHVVGEQRRIQRCPLEWFQAVKPQHITIVRGSKKQPKGIKLRVLSQIAGCSLQVEACYPENAWSQGPRDDQADQAVYYTFWPGTSQTTWHTAALALNAVSGANSCRVVLVMKHNTQNDDTRLVQLASRPNQSVEEVCRSFRGCALPEPCSPSLELIVAPACKLLASSKTGKVQISLVDF